MRHVFTALTLFLIIGCASRDDPQSPGSNGGNVDNYAGPYLVVDVPACATLDPAPIPPITTFEWTLVDGATAPDKVRWILVDTRRFNESWEEALDYIRGHPDAPEWSEWQPYDAGNDIGTQWTTAPLDLGTYVFAAHGKKAHLEPSEDFAFGRNAIKARVSHIDAGPLLTLTNEFMDPIQAATPWTVPTAVRDLPAGTPVVFCWTADASRYCGVIAAYRYGWDITDLEADDQWEIDFTPYDGEACSAPRTFYFGTRTFYVEVIDNSGFRTRIVVVISFTQRGATQPRPHSTDYRLSDSRSRRLRGVHTTASRLGEQATDEQDKRDHVPIIMLAIASSFVIAK